MVQYEVHRSSDYIDYRKEQLKEIRTTKANLQKRLQKLTGKT